MKLMLRTRQISHLLLGVAGIGILAALLNLAAPNSWQIITVFFVLTFLTTFFFMLFILRNTRRSFLISCGVIAYLTLRLLHLSNIIYPLLLTASLFSVEWIATRR